MPASNLRRELVESVTGQLQPLGFTRRRNDGIFTIQLTPDVLGILSLNTATEHLRGAIDVNPIVGARHQGLERIVAELRADSIGRYLPATVTMPLGYLMPEDRLKQWRFVKENVAPQAAALAAAVHDYGLPPLTSVSSVQDFLALVERGWGVSWALMYRLPVALALAGDARGARNRMNLSLMDLDGRDDKAAREFRAFADAFRLWMPTVEDKTNRPA